MMVVGLTDKEMRTMICKYYEYKIVKAHHFHSRVLEPKGFAYAIITTTKLIAEPDAQPCVNLDNEEDMYVVARNLDQASQILNDVVDKNIVEGDVAESFLVESMKDNEEVAYK